MDSLVLIGIKHCGKSTLGRLLAQQYGLEFFDSDAELEKQFYMDSGSRCSCREIFKYLGEEKFRELEALVITGLVSDVPKVIALGGGAVSNPFLKRDILKSLGRIVWLDTDEEIAYKRVIKNGLPPFLADAEDPRKRFSEMNSKRRQLFSQVADAVFTNTEELEKKEAVQRLAAVLEGQLQK
jgi:shikimate kinase